MNRKLAGLLSLALGGMVSAEALAQATTLPAEAGPAPTPFVGSETPVSMPLTRSMTPIDSGVCAPNSCCLPCAPGPSYWGSAEYLLWWFKDGRVGFPLVTTGDPADTIGGGLEDPNTRVLFGPGDVDYGNTSGGRLTIGGWLDPANTFGFEVRGLLTESSSFDRVFSSNGNTSPLLAIPFFNTNPGAFPGGLPQELAAQASLAAGPGAELAGSISLHSTSRIWGVEANGVWGNGVGIPGNTQALIGFRYFDLQESFNIGFNSQAVGTTTFSISGVDLGTGASHQVNDYFSTRNQFYGPQIGLRGEQAFGRFILGWSGKAAVGAMHQVVNITGTTASTAGLGGVPPAGTVLLARGGIFALPTNSGRQTNTEFAVIPEAELKVGYQLNPRLRLFAGYNFTYVSNVARPADQINRRINGANVPAISGPFFNPASNGTPTQSFNTTDFWAHGINFGITMNW